MKIYYLANARMPTERAHGIQIAKMCEALLAAGADITLVVPARGKKQLLQEYYGLSREISLVRVPVFPYALGFWIGSCSFMLSAFFFLFLKKLRGERFVVYTIDMDQFSFALVPFLSVPYFVEIHDTKPQGFLFSLLFRRALGILTINHIIKKKLCELFGISSEKILVSPNGIDVARFSLSPKANTGERRKIALSTGQFYDLKGLEIVPATARLLPDTQCILVGGTRDEFMHLTGIRDIPDNLEFVGKRPYPEIPAWLARADVLFVIGTKQNEYSYYHTSPMKLFEYLPTLRPIVAAHTPAIADMVSDKEVFFYEPDSAASFASAIQRALADGSHAPQVSAARSLAEKYSWKSRAEKVLSYLSQKRRGHR